VTNSKVCLSLMLMRRSKLRRPCGWRIFSRGDPSDPGQHPIAIALRRQEDIDDARVTKNETLVRRGKRWFRYDAPDKKLFKRLQKDLTTRG
jgi:hypothetical protein